MATDRPSLSNVQILPATAERRSDLEALFGEKGACAGCRCQMRCILAD